MPVTIPFTFTAGTKARAAEVNANFQALKAKFTEGSGGVADADIYTGADINASKLSSTPGKRITAAQMEDNAVDGRVLKDDPTAGSANAAVNLEAHVKDGLIPKNKLSTASTKQISIAQLDIAIEEVTYVQNIGGSINPEVVVERAVVGDHYVGKVVSQQDTSFGGPPTSFNVAPVTTPVLTASRKLLAVYLADTTYVNPNLSGKVVFVSMPNS